MSKKGDTLGWDDVGIKVLMRLGALEQAHKSHSMRLSNIEQNHLTEGSRKARLVTERMREVLRKLNREQDGLLHRGRVNDERLAQMQQQIDTLRGFTRQVQYKTNRTFPAYEAPKPREPDEVRRLHRRVRTLERIIRSMVAALYEKHGCDTVDYFPNGANALDDASNMAQEVMDVIETKKLAETDLVDINTRSGYESIPYFFKLFNEEIKR